MIEILFFLPSRGELTNPEGAIVYSIWAVATGTVPLYRDFSLAPYSTTPYAPFYYWLCGGLARLLGTVWAIGTDEIYWIARGITVAATVGTAAFLGRLASLIFPGLSPRSTRLLAFLIPAALVTLRPWAFSARVDALAVFFSLAGFTVWLSLRERRPLRAAAFAGLLFSAAVWTKQSYGVAGLSVGLVLIASRKWQEATMLAAVFLIATVPGFRALDEATGGLFFRNLFEANATDWKWGQLGWLVRKGFLMGGLGVLILAAIGAHSLPRSAWRSFPLRAFAVYCVLSFVAHLAACLKQGAYYNYWMEPHWLACGWAIFGVFELERRIPRPTFVRGWSWVMLIALIQAWHYLPELRLQVRERREMGDRAWVDRMLSLPGPALITHSGLVIRREETLLLLDSFNAAYLERRGKADLSPLAQRIRNGEIPWLLIEYYKHPDDRDAKLWWPPSIHEAIRDRYERVEGNGILEVWKWKP